MASKGVNKVILVGNLGKDPEIRYMPSGGAVANITLATSESWKDKNTGEQKEKTEWHNVSIFGKLAEIAGEYLRKGSQIYIEGALQTRKWQDQNGNDRYTTEVVVQGFNGTMQMLGGRQGGGQPSGGFNQGAQGGQPQGGFQQQAPAAAPQQQGGFQQQAPAAAPQQQGGFQQQAPAQQQGGYNQTPQQAAPQQGGFQQQGQQQQAKAPDLDEGWDDDIPF